MNLGGTVKVNKVGVCIVTACFLLLFVYIFIGHSDDTNSKLLSLTEDEESRVNMKSLLIASKEVCHRNITLEKVEILGFSLMYVQVAEKGGQQVIAVKKESSLHVKSKGKTKEGVVDPVTDADFRSHCVMYHGLKKKFQNLKV